MKIMMNSLLKLHVKMVVRAATASSFSSLDIHNRMTLALERESKRPEIPQDQP
jgi:hypothetical protein